MDLSNYVTVLPIVIICYLVGIGCKASKKISDKVIPVIVGIVGGIIAVPAMYVMKSFPAEDIITAISSGHKRLTIRVFFLKRLKIIL